LKGYYLLRASLGDLYLKLGQAEKDREYLARTAGMTTSRTEINFLNGNMEP
jgi:predicted RNA polymerase sigma factor